MGFTTFTAYTFCCCGSSVITLYLLDDEVLNPAERWTILGAFVAVVMTIIFRLTNKVDNLGTKMDNLGTEFTKGLGILGEVIGKGTAETVRLNDTMGHLLTQIAETNRIAATERDKAVAALKEHIDTRCGPKE